MSHSRHGAITGKLRRQRLVGQLETNLVVALARAAVRQRVAAGLASATSTCRLASSGRAIEVPSKYLCSYTAARAHHPPQVLGDELLAHIGDVNFRRAGLAGLLFQALQLVFALPDVAAHRDHFAL